MDERVKKIFGGGQQDHFQPLGRVGRPDEVAKLVAFMASDDNCFMTGTDVDFDGGAHLTSPQVSEKDVASLIKKK